MTMKRTIDAISEAPTSDLSKTERRRLAKRAKKERQRSQGNKPRQASRSGESILKQDKGSRPKMTKEERKAKYTKQAYDSREKLKKRVPGVNKTRCLGCRAWGHVMADCPDAKENIGICFNCGSKNHPLRKCPRPTQEDGGLPFATCFVCKQKGHLSAKCEQNANGIYPKGGSCKGCGSKYHLSRNCPEREQSAKINSFSEEDQAVGSGTEARRGRAEESSDFEKQSVVGGSNGVMKQGRPGSRVNGVAHSVAVTPTMTGGKDKAKRPTEGDPRSFAQDSKRRPAKRLPGGDDLEEDGYFEFDDAPGLLLRGNASGSDDEPEAGLQTKEAGSKGGNKRSRKPKSKVVVF